MSKIRRVSLFTAIVLIALTSIEVAYATGAHLWFYSVDPATLPDWTGTIDGTVNPQDDDPNYVGVTSDSWTTESVVVPNSDWDTPYSLWIGNADPHDACYDTMLVISVNDAAAAAISGISVNGNPVGAWDQDKGDFPLPPHGISNSAEWYGFVEVNVGDIPSGCYIEIEIDVDLNVGADLTGAKIHYDAYGWSTEVHTGKYDIFSPFSHDFTFVVPEVATIALEAASLLALGTYAYKRKKQ